MKSLVDRIYHSVIKRNDIYRFYDLYRKSQYWPIEKQEDYQLHLFQKLWTHAINHVPFYQDLFKNNGIEKINSLKDLQKLPIIDKDIFRTDINKFKALNIPEERFLQNSTSGSSGSNFFFFSDKKQIQNSKALMMRRYDWMGVNIYDKETSIWGSSWDNKKKESFRKKHWKSNKKQISGYNLSEDNVLGIYQQLVADKPKIIKSYPSILTYMAEIFKANNLSYKPKAIHIGGEKLYDFQKQIIEDTFDAKVYDFYGARDMPNIAQSCVHDTGLHVFTENVIVEVVDDKGYPIEEGEGDLVITNLHNYVMPFIRYKIGDRASISKYKKCACGRTLPLLDEILGRTFELITFPNGNRVMGTFWTLLFRSVKGIQDFQVTQENIYDINIKYTTTDEFSKESVQKLTGIIKEYGGDSINVQFMEIDKIEPNKAGKRSFVISKIQAI